MFKLTRYEMPAILIVACFFLPFFYMPPFVDDVARYSYGYIGLASQGRFLTELYYILLNSSGKSRCLSTEPCCFICYHDSSLQLLC